MVRLRVRQLALPVVVTLGLAGVASSVAQAAFTSLADSDFLLQINDSDIGDAYVIGDWPTDEPNSARIGEAIERGGVVSPSLDNVPATQRPTPRSGDTIRLTAYAQSPTTFAYDRPTSNFSFVHRATIKVECGAVRLSGVAPNGPVGTAKVAVTGRVPYVEGIVRRTADNYVVTLSRPVSAGQTVNIEFDQTAGHARIQTFMRRKVPACSSGGKPPALSPVVAQYGVASAVSGSVTIRRGWNDKKGAPWNLQLKPGEMIPSGATLEATKGRVTLKAALRGSKTRSLTLSGGTFVVTHGRSGMTVRAVRGSVKVDDRVGRVKRTLKPLDTYVTK